MSQSNLEKLTRLYDGWGAGDWTDTSIFDPHAVGVFPDPTPSVQYGMQAMGTYMRRFLDSWEDIRMEAEDFHQAGDSVVVRVHRIAAGKTSGVPLDDRVFHVWTFRGGTVVRMELFEREVDALEAVGLRQK